MRRPINTFLAAQPLPTTGLWLALGSAWIAALAAALLKEPVAAIALTLAGLVLVSTLGFAPIRHAFFGEQRKLEALLNAVPEGILEIDAAGNIVFVNPQLCDLFGYGPTELLGQPVERLVPPAARAGHADRRSAFWASSRSRSMGSSLDISGVRKDGSLVAVDVSLSRLETRHGTVMYCLVRDNSARRAFETQLLDSNRRLSESVSTLERNSLELQTLTEMGELLHSSNNEPELYGIVAHTMHRLFPGWSGALYILTDSRSMAAAACTWGTNTAGLKATIPGDDCWALRRGRPHHSDKQGDHPSCNHQAGRSQRCGHCIPLLGQGELMGILHLSGDNSSGSQDLSAPSSRQLLQALANQVALSLANLRLRETLRSQSTIDPLTGLHNRRVIDERFDTAVRQARSEHREVSLMVLDIDHFKSFNDRFGHDCGDIALREISALLRRSLRHDDVICRMGGEEFAVLLPDTSLADATQVADKLRMAVGALRLQRDGQQLARVTVSAGLAALGTHGDTVATLLRHADRALYRAKAGGRDCVMVSGSADDTGLHPKVALVPLQA
jgi:diguanylate cyclase (GGDEF)-like protein/PAS domain S-box-containing protein